MATVTPSLGPILGAFELGVLCSSILYGVMLVQSYNYYQLKFNDSLFIRLIVGIYHNYNLSKWL